MSNRSILEAPYTYINENTCHANYHIQKRKAINTKINYIIINTTRALQSKLYVYIKQALKGYTDY